MRSRLHLFAILLLCALFLTGCKTTLLVHNAAVKDIIPVLKDYAGSHGYRISYENDQTGTFGLDMGSVYVPYSSSTVQSTTIIKTANPHQPLTAYEETTWNTVGNSEHYVQAAASVNIIQQGADVELILDGNDAAGGSLNDFYDYLKGLGYTVENK